MEININTALSNDEPTEKELQQTKILDETFRANNCVETDEEINHRK